MHLNKNIRKKQTLHNIITVILYYAICTHITNDIGKKKVRVKTSDT